MDISRLNFDHQSSSNCRACDRDAQFKLGVRLERANPLTRCDVLNARDDTPGKVVQWIAALLHAEEVSGSVLLRYGILPFQLTT